MSAIPSLVTSISQPYISDEDLISDLSITPSLISFTVDLIDSTLDVKLHILPSDDPICPLFQLVYGSVDRIVGSDPSFSFVEFWSDLLENFLGIRNLKIEEYDGSSEDEGESEFDSPPTPLIDEDDDDGLQSEDESEEEGEGEILIEVSGLLGDDDVNGEEDDALAIARAAMNLTRDRRKMAVTYEILNPEALISQQDKAVQLVAERLFMSTPGAKILLRSYGWNVEKIMNRFLENGKDVVLSEVGLSSKDFEATTSSSSLSAAGGGIESELFECPACFDDVEEKDTTQIEACGHRFCDVCWKRHLEIKIGDGLSRRILCMGRNCKCPIDETLVAKFVVDDEARKRYETKVLESFVEDNENLKWCQSAPHCGNAAAIRVSPEDPVEVHCSCGECWCFGCLDQGHLPTSCFMAETWRRKTDGDKNETLMWIKRNTRKCPGCKKRTEKNGGCNHISCTCGAHWCWACGKKFDVNTVYSHRCNAYLEKSKQALGDDYERYLHHFTRFNAHAGSLKNQRTMRMEMSESLLSDRSDATWTDLEWLQNSLEVLLDARSALMWSYVFAYYVFRRTAYQPLPPLPKSKIVRPGEMMPTPVGGAATTAAVDRRRGRGRARTRARTRGTRGTRRGGGRGSDRRRRGRGGRKGTRSGARRSTGTRRRRAPPKVVDPDEPLRRTRPLTSREKRILELERRRALKRQRILAARRKRLLSERERDRTLLAGIVNFRTIEARLSAKNLFEDKQDVLETSVEQLNEKLDLPLVELLGDEDLRPWIMSQSVLTEKYIHALFEVIREHMILEDEFRMPPERYIMTERRVELSEASSHLRRLKAETSSRQGREEEDIESELAASLGISVEEYEMQAALIQSLVTGD